MSEINGVERETANSYYQNNKPSKKFSIDCNFMVDMMFTDFKSFEPLLGAENVDLLKQSGSNLVFELAFNYNRFSYGLSFGYDHNQDSTDMLNLNLYNYQYALRFGYNIIDSRYFRITPLVRLKWHIFDLHNSDKGDKIPLEQYLANKELDLKFNQLTGVVGCNLTYKTGVSYAGLGNIGVGIYGGYIFKLNDKPWVYSEEQHLTTANKIDLKKLDLGFYCMFYFDD
jgi:outer membrane receptor protein involved in Fe transport